jgi:hypothetical protein
MSRRVLVLIAGSGLVAASVAACGGAVVEGRYLGQGQTFFNSLTLGPDGKVEIVFAGRPHNGTYEVADESVTVTVPNGDRLRFKREPNGCLAGNELYGTYCKEGSAAAAASRGSTGGHSTDAAAGGEPSGAYEATVAEGRLSLDFAPAGKVRVTMTPTGPSEMPDRVSFDVGYDVSGDQVTVSLPGNERLLLTRRGNTLEGTMSGETVRFARR